MAATPARSFFSDERKKMVGVIFDEVQATPEGIERLEPGEEWRPYPAAAIPTHWVPTERKTGAQPAIAVLGVRDGGLDLLRQVA